MASSRSNLTIILLAGAFFFASIKADEVQVNLDDNHHSRKLWLVTDRPKTTVHIDSQMGQGVDLVVRCWSSETDCGQQKIEDGQSYSIRFRPNVSGSTEFVCSLAWQGGTLTNTFYDYGRDIHRCHKNCEWIANTTAVYGVSWSYGGIDTIFPWIPTGSK
ncbi:hypothetical protein Dimus_029542 [Dionaea muscipula]